MSRVRQERAPLLDTLKQLVEIESGSSDIEGLDRIRDVIAKRLSALGAMMIPGALAARMIMDIAQGKAQ